MLELVLFLVGVIVVGTVYMYWDRIKPKIMWYVKYDYPVKILFLKKRGKGLITQIDKAKKKLDKKSKTYYYDTVKNGKIPRLDVNFMTADNFAIVYEYRPGEFLQVDANKIENKKSVKQLAQLNPNEVVKLEDVLELRPITESSRDFFIREIRTAITKYAQTSFIDKWLPTLIVGFIIIILVAVFASQVWMPMLDHMDKIGKSLAQVSSQNREMVQLLLNSSKGVVDSVAAGQAPINVSVPY